MLGAFAASDRGDVRGNDREGSRKHTLEIEYTQLAKRVRRLDTLGTSRSKSEHLATEFEQDDERLELERRQRRRRPDTGGADGP